MVKILKTSEVMDALKNKKSVCACCFTPIKIIKKLKDGTAVCKRCYNVFGAQDRLNCKRF